MQIKTAIHWVVECLFLRWQPFQRVCLRRRRSLFVKISKDGSVKIGTCQQCVVREQGRPGRAWTATGESELDFPRDQLIERLASFGLQVEIEQEYVCP